MIEPKYNENRNKKPLISDTWLGNYLNINYKSIGGEMLSVLIEIISKKNLGGMYTYVSDKLNMRKFLNGSVNYD